MTAWYLPIRVADKAEMNTMLETKAHVRPNRFSVTRGRRSISVSAVSSRTVRFDTREQQQSWPSIGNDAFTFLGFWVSYIPRPPPFLVDDGQVWIRPDLYLCAYTTNIFVCTYVLVSTPTHC